MHLRPIAELGRGILKLLKHIRARGLFSHEKIKGEITFPAMIERIRLFKPKRTILTHVEEIEMNVWSWDYLKKMKEQYSDVNFDFAYDGMEIGLQRSAHKDLKVMSFSVAYS